VEPPLGIGPTVG